jgi:uncharacterized protein YggE
MLNMSSDPADPDSNDTIPTVTVRGDAIIRTEPDEALLWITLSALQDAPGPALSDVSARSNALVVLLDELGVARTDRSTTGITVYEDFDHTQSGRRSLGHRAISRVSVRLTDPELIGRLIAQSTEDLAARIDGPRWQIAPDNPVRLQAAREAAADGQRKAQAYAEGVGAKLGQLIRLTEPADAHVVARAAGGLRPMAAELMPVEPGEHEVAASIHATFALELIGCNVEPSWS